MSIFRRHNPDDTLTRDQQDRMLIVMVSGGIDGPERVLAEYRLMFARDLVEHGRIGHDSEGTGDDR